MNADDYYTWQSRKQRRDLEKTQEVQVSHLYPEPKKNRMSDTGIKRLSGKGRKKHV